MKIFRTIVALIFFIAWRAMAIEGIEDVKEEIKMQKALDSVSDKQLYLIIGVRCGEDGFNERFGHLLHNPKIFVIFGDSESPIENIKGHCLKGDFNSENEIAELAENFKASFDVISTDGVGTTKFLFGYNDTIIRLLAQSLKVGGRLFYHDSVDVNFYGVQSPGSANIKILSSDDMRNYKERLPFILGSGFNKLPARFYVPEEFISNIEVSDDRVNELTTFVFELITNYQPGQFYDIVNKLQKLGLINANLIKGRQFAVKENEEIKPLVKKAFQKNIFHEKIMPTFVADLKEILKKAMKSSLSNEFSLIDVVSQDNDNESLDILIPKDKDSVGYIVYKFKK